MEQIIIEKDIISPADLLPSAFQGDVKSIKKIYLDKQHELGFTNRQIQKLLSMEPKTLNAILDGKAKRINFLSVIKLANFLNINLSDIAKSYLSTLNSIEVSEMQNARDFAYIQEHFNVKALQHCHFFKRGDDIPKMRDRVMTFFGLESLYEYTNAGISTAFSRINRKTNNDLMREFWVTSAYDRFLKISNPNDYNRDALLKLIPKIRPYTMDINNGFKTVMRALFQVGVTVLYQPSLEGVQVRGATMIINNKPCIVICDIYKRYPTIWFSLLHELHHVLFDYDMIKSEAYHISDGEGDLLLTNEVQADDFASVYLLNESRLEFARRYINSPVMLSKFARQCGVHPSIIYARHCYETKEWPLYNKFIPKSDEALVRVNVNPFAKETLAESMKDIKELYKI